MREILFRGKQVDNGEWVEGIAFPHDGDKVTMFRQHPMDGSLVGFEVIPETVGQYTGLRDKNGERIFEGDIIEYNGTKHRVVFENRFQTAYFGIVMSAMETWSFSNSVPANMMEVIGNIHDNPELMGGEKRWTGKGKNV